MQIRKSSIAVAVVIVVLLGIWLYPFIVIWEGIWAFPLMLATILSFVLIIIGLVGLLRKGPDSIWLGTFAGGLGYLLLIYLTYNIYRIEPADWAQIILMGGLVVATFVYALMAIRQANSSTKMAHEMMEQRYSESLPLLVPTIPRIFSTDELPYECLQSGAWIQVIWRNIGKGAAINSKLYFYPIPTSSGKAELFPPYELGTLEIGGKKEIDFNKIFESYKRETKLLNDKRWQQISDEYQPRLEAEYLDIYERTITTVQEFRIDEQNKKAFVGELYFKVNDKRLGEVSSP